MGFVVDNHINKSSVMYDSDIPRKNQALVYGKAEYMWDVSIRFLASDCPYSCKNWDKLQHSRFLTNKQFFFLQGKADYLKIIKEYVDIHATVFLENGQSQVIPGECNAVCFKNI